MNLHVYVSSREHKTFTPTNSRQSVDNLNRSIGHLDSNADKLIYLDYFSFVFNVPKKFSFEPHKGDEVSQVNAQSVIRYEMEKRFEKLDNRLKTLKAEKNEYFYVKNCDRSRSG